MEQACGGDPDGNQYRAGLIQNSNAALWGGDLFGEFGDMSPHGAHGAQFDGAQRRNRLVALDHLEVIELRHRLGRRQNGKRRRAEPARALLEWPGDGNLPSACGVQLIFTRAQPGVTVY